ncbi:hypothetical protein [Lacticaseibacillus sp. N501-2]|uniref:hypothetical protein n=1 Tax=Lacticaseibacillus salsurae TaxID=3367729 RepID=UPI0038B2CB5D
MKYHEFLKLSFTDTVLARYLQVSVATIKKLRHDEPVQHQTILNIGKRLMLSDEEIITHLQRLSTVKRSPPITLDPRNLSGPLNAVPLPDDSTQHFSISTALADPQQLMVAIVDDTPKHRKRLNHSLYADQWQKYPTCRFDELKPKILIQLMRSVFNLSSPANVVVDTNYHDRRTLALELAILQAIQTPSIQSAVTIDIDHQSVAGIFDRQSFHNFQQHLTAFVLQHFQINLTIRSIAASKSLGIQVAQLVALTTVVLPADQLRKNHIHAITLDTKLHDPTLVQLLAFENDLA